MAFEGFDAGTDQLQGQHLPVEGGFTCRSQKRMKLLGSGFPIQVSYVPLSHLWLPSKVQASSVPSDCTTVL